MSEERLVLNDIDIARLESDEFELFQVDDGVLRDLLRLANELGLAGKKITDVVKFRKVGTVQTEFDFMCEDIPPPKPPPCKDCAANPKKFWGYIPDAPPLRSVKPATFDSFNGTSTTLKITSNAYATATSFSPPGTVIEDPASGGFKFIGTDGHEEILMPDFSDPFTIKLKTVKP